MAFLLSDAQHVILAVPSAPPRKVEVAALNSTALKVMWRSPVPNKQHGQIRGYQVHYVEVVDEEARGRPLIRDIMLTDAQVRKQTEEWWRLVQPTETVANK